MAVIQFDLALVVVNFCLTYSFILTGRKITHISLPQTKVQKSQKYIFFARVQAILYTKFQLSNFQTEGRFEVMEG